MRQEWQVTGARAASDWRSWFSALGVFALAALFVVTKVAEHLLGLRRWHSFGNREIAILLGQALVVAVVVWAVRHRVQSQLDVAERRRQQAAALVAENAAVVRVARAVMHEFAQPLSGVLCYSELLLMSAQRWSADERQQVAGLREGALQLTHLLQTMRYTVDSTPDDLMRHVADDVERFVAASHPRPCVHIAGTTCPACDWTHSVTPLTATRAILDRPAHEITWQVQHEGQAWQA